MQRYQVCEKLGDGTYGSVWKAKNKENGATVAIKQLKQRYNNWEDCVVLRELESLQCLSKHENVVDLKEVIRENDSQLQFVFEFMPEGSLFDLIKKCAANRLLEQISKHGPAEIPLAHPEISMTFPRVRSILQQLFAGLDYIHSHGFVHRDIKPENILLDGDKVKIADFGLARQMGKCSDSAVENLTDYVSTRWYRAPEVLLRSPSYGSAIDIFATGCVLAELVTCKPLFPGSSELDQIYKVFSVLGNLKLQNVTDGINLDKRISIACVAGNTESLLTSCLSHKNLNPACRMDYSARARIGNLVQVDMPFIIPILDSLLKLNPNDRTTASVALTHPFFLKNPTRNKTNVSGFPKIVIEHSSNQEHKPLRKRQFKTLSKSNAMNPFHLSTEFDDFETGYNVKPIHLSGYSTPGLESDGSASPFSSPDILSCFNDIRKDLLSSDSYGCDSVQGYQSKPLRLSAEYDSNHDQDKFVSTHCSNTSFENMNTKIHKQPQTKKSRIRASSSHILGGFGRSKFR